MTQDLVAEAILCDRDPEVHIERLREFDRAGYDRVVVQQVGVDQERFLRLYEDAILPELTVVRSA